MSDVKESHKREERLELVREQRDFLKELVLELENTLRLVALVLEKEPKL